MRVIVDIETDSLNPTKVWCIVCKDIDTNLITTFVIGVNLNDFKAFIKDATLVIGHNIIGFDYPVVNRLCDVSIPVSILYDTLVISRLCNPVRSGGHSLGNWGQLLNFPKGDFTDFSRYSEDMLTYCVQDVNLTHKVYNRLQQEAKDFSNESINLENSVQYILEKQKQYGFYLNTEKAIDIRTLCLQEMKDIEREVEVSFLPKPKLVRGVTLKYNKDGSLSLNSLTKFTRDDIGGDYSLIEYEKFNMASPKQVVERMTNYGWKPTVFNKPTELMVQKGLQGSPKICEENITTLPDTAPLVAKKIGTYLMCANRANLVSQWFGALGNDGRIHGSVFNVGAITHRCSHINPNMGNIPSIETDSTGAYKKEIVGRFGYECRDSFTVSDVNTRRLIGVDAKAIQLRVLAHYINDPTYTDAVINGDIHVVHRDILGLEGTQGRSVAKTFIYAFLLGGGDAKLGSIVGGTAKDGTVLRARFLDRVQGLKRIKTQNIEDARRGWMIGLDGRRIQIKSAHFALSSYLQGGEAVIMKVALVNWYNTVKRLKLDAMPVAFVHDEFQVESAANIAEQVGDIIINSIRNTSTILKLNCPMDGEAKIGLTWAGTH